MSRKKKKRLGMLMRLAKEGKKGKEEECPGMMSSVRSRGREDDESTTDWGKQEYPQRYKALSSDP